MIWLQNHVFFRLFSVSRLFHYGVYFTRLVICIFINNSLVHLNGMYYKSTNNTISQHQAEGEFVQPSHRLETLRYTNTSMRVRGLAMRRRWNWCRQVMMSKVERNRPQDDDDADDNDEKIHYRKLMQNLATYFVAVWKNQQWWFSVRLAKWIPPTNYAVLTKCMCYTATRTHTQPIMGFLFNFCSG